MQQSDFILKDNILIANRTYRARLQGVSAFSVPGQFANIEIPELYLRRPFSVCDWDDEGFDIIYKVVGDGTLALSRMCEGKINALTGLGNGFDTAVAAKTPVLIGGGSGVPPLYGLAKRLGTACAVILGFGTKSEVFLAHEFEKLGCAVTVVTQDGSMGLKGLVTDALAGQPHDYVFACGPNAMLKAIYEKTDADLQFSFEARMACGFGACMGCSCETTLGSKRVCADGPVFKREEIIWPASK